MVARDLEWLDHRRGQLKVDEWSWFRWGVDENQFAESFVELVEEFAVAVEQGTPRRLTAPDLVDGGDLTPGRQQLAHRVSVADGPGEQHPVQAAGTRACEHVDDDVAVPARFDKTAPEGIPIWGCRASKLVDLRAGATRPHGQADAAAHAEGQAKFALHVHGCSSSLGSTQ